MTFWPLLASTGLYLWTACGFWASGNKPLAVAFAGYAVAFAGYAVANCGFLWLAWPR